MMNVITVFVQLKTIYFKLWFFYNFDSRIYALDKQRKEKNQILTFLDKIMTISF